MASRKCTRKKTVRVKGHTKKVCAKFSGKGRRPKNKGKKCTQFGRSHGRKVCRKYGRKAA